jgi:glutathione S-transferase
MDVLCEKHDGAADRRSRHGDALGRRQGLVRGARLPILEDRVRDRLGELSRRLADSDWLEGEFSAGDLLMVTLLRRLNGSGMLEEYPNLFAYVARGEAWPAFKRAFDAQLAVFTALSAH